MISFDNLENNDFNYTNIIPKKQKGKNKNKDSSNSKGGKSRKGGKKGNSWFNVNIYPCSALHIFSTEAV